MYLGLLGFDFTGEDVLEDLDLLLIVGFILLWLIYVVY
jgi:hypothetical protein